MSEAEIAAREALVLGAPPRVTPLETSQMSEPALELVREIGITLGYPPGWEIEQGIAEWFRIMAHDPALFRLQMETGIHLLGHGALPAVERELAVLRTGWLARAPYEWSEHVRIARGLGMDADAIARVREGSAAPGWSTHEAAILRAVEELFAEDMISDETWATLAASWDERQLIELPALVGQYRAVAGMQNSLRLPINPDTRGLREG